MSEPDDDLLDPHVACDLCNEEHPLGVLEDGLCPACCDYDEALEEAALLALDTIHGHRP